MKRIMHIDMNSFFISCELMEYSDVFSMKMVIGGDISKRKGIISAASYGAREYGITSAMNIAEAIRLCPDLIVRPVNMELYRQTSNDLMNFLRTEFKILEQASIDECYVDISELVEKYGSEWSLARNIQKKIKNRFNLPCSIGIGDNKLQAKMSSNYKKPEGITIINSKTFTLTFQNLDISAIHGLGKESQKRYNNRGIYKIKDIISYDFKKWVSNGFNTEHYNKAFGIGQFELDTFSFKKNKSISNEVTLPKDIFIESELFASYKNVFNRAFERLISKEYFAKGVSLKVKYSDFSQKQKIKSIRTFTNDKNQLENLMNDLIIDCVNVEKGVRLISVGFTNLISSNEYKSKYERYFFPFQKFIKGEQDE